jgi:hypothetical protein
MIVATSLIALSVLTASVDAAALRRQHNFPVPPTYDAAWLEPYDTYHARYLALSCYSKHNTTYFDDCCHPLLKTEKLETARLPKCIPGNNNSDDDDEDCDDDSEVPSGAGNAASDPADQPSPSAPNPPPTSSAALPPPPPPPASPAPPPPAPSTSEKPKPTSSSETPKPTSTSTSEKPAPTSGAGGLLSNLFSAFSLTSSIKSGGEATWFTQNGNAGNCGTVHQDSDFVVALPTVTYANGAHCGKKIAIVDTESGKSAVATVADSCPTCPNPNSLDCSTALFNHFADANKGVFNVAWAFIQD